MNIAKYALESFHGGAKEQNLGNNYVQRHHMAERKTWQMSFWKSLKSVLGCFVSENTFRTFAG